MAGYIGSTGVSSPSRVSEIRDTFTAAQGQTVFNTSAPFTPAVCSVFLNGSKLVNGADYDSTSGNSIVLATGATAGDIVEFIGRAGFTVADAYTKAEVYNKSEVHPKAEVYTKAEVDSGSVLQVVNLVSTTQSSQTITGTDTQVGELVKTITPKGANSKFLVTVRFFGEMQEAWNICFNIHKDGARVNCPNIRNYGLTVPTQSYVANDNASTPEPVNMTTLVDTDSVIGTDIEFKVVADSSGNKTLWNNRCFRTSSGGYERGTSEIIITEIGA